MKYSLLYIGTTVRITNGAFKGRVGRVQAITLYAAAIAFAAEGYDTRWINYTDLEVIDTKSTNRKRLAAVTAAYTGFLVGNFDDMHQYIEELLGYPVFTMDLASDLLCREIKEKSKPEFIQLWREFLENE